MRTRPIFGSQRARDRNDRLMFPTPHPLSYSATDRFDCTARYCDRRRWLNEIFFYLVIHNSRARAWTTQSFFPGPFPTA
jgi:hypothetical protein